MAHFQRERPRIPGTLTMRIYTARQPEDQGTREAADPRGPCPADPSALTGISGHLYFAENRTLLRCVDTPTPRPPLPDPRLSVRSVIYARCEGAQRIVTEPQEMAHELS